MADTKISALTSAGSLDGTETLPLIQAGANKKALLSTIATYIASTVTVAFSAITGKPTTLSGYGITDAQPLDSDLTAIAALSTTSFGRSLLASADAAALRSTAGVVIGTNVQAWSGTLDSIAAQTVTTDSTTARTAALADAFTFIRFTSSSAVTFTIPPNSSVAFPVGTGIEFSQSGTGAVSAAAGAGVTINSRSADLTLAGQYAVAFVKKVATDTWIMNGDL